MSEGGVYRSEWSLEQGVYRVWLSEHPELSASGPDFEAAADELASCIGAWNGDGEAVLEFPIGRPGGSQEGVLLTLRNLGYNESVRATNRDPSQFEGGICSHCQFGIGKRTSTPLQIDRTPTRNVAGVDRTLPRALIVSEGFLALLGEHERAAIRTQPVVARKGAPFFELIGDPLARTVGLVGAEYPSAFSQSWRCRKCGRRDFAVRHPGFPSNSCFLGTESLDLPPPSLFVFDEGSRLSIAVSPQRWAELAKQAGAKGFTSDDLFIVDDTLAEVTPELEAPEEFDWIL